MQSDLFGDLVAEKATIEERAPSECVPLISELPEVLRPRCEPVLAKPISGPELDAWTRHTRRLYLLYLVGALLRLNYRDSMIQNARGVLFKLNGLGGEW